MNSRAFQHRVSTATRNAAPSTAPRDALDTPAFTRHRPPASPSIALPVLLGLWLIAPGCSRTPSSSEPLRLATTTSYLEAAARDLLGDQLHLLRLAEPGTCPGHFDLRPSQVQELRHCAALFRFDFQSSLDSKIAALGTDRPFLAEISLTSGLGHPTSYQSACRQVADHLVDLGLLAQSESDLRLANIDQRLVQLERQTSHRVLQLGWTGKPVIASTRQRDFCAWLGLKVIATFRGADTTSFSELETALAAAKAEPVKLIIANLPEGRRTAEALAHRLQAAVVVFENFPALRDGRLSFDDMVQANLAALEHAGCP
jgi:zinc transport system substrate-binding protein